MTEISTMIEQLDKAFDAANKEFWEEQLPKPMIIVARKNKKHELGYITVNKVWHPTESGEEKTAECKYEINISAEALERPIEEIVGILIHEMVHEYNLVHNIKDTSMGQVHNKNFKKEAERVGLEVSKGTGVGFGVTFPSVELTAKIETWGIDGSVFSYVRVEDPEKETPPKQGKWKYVNPVDPKKKFTCKFKVRVLSLDEGEEGTEWNKEYVDGDDEAYGPEGPGPKQEEKVDE